MSQSNHTYQLLISAVVGVGRTIGGLPLQHPLDTIRTRALGFYSGAVPNTTRRAVKQTYRWPMMLYFSTFYREKILSQNLQQTYPRLPKILTGLSVANFEIIAINPLERLKVWLLTSPQRTSITKFFPNNKTQLVKELYRGTSASKCTVGNIFIYR
ncbi:unnamed protein product [Didymodactylos carnosus]|uniref:Uncharacterized protein n=1 Tax=Didymodactylos carnosus TaxID=1234261 RepID=A0A814T1J8_9BILA|nr:unnamed protein product [Didymodactylos carnosus]CAF1155385.1 unnamed protein product [Didymodactylos carnosus]CAF3592655.1 unnamed protein product [Didymodactylos carnosus]CAF3918826.1 unnamed protein product [Didymodactylos carnosus]